MSTQAAGIVTSKGLEMTTFAGREEERRGGDLEVVNRIPSPLIKQESEANVTPKPLKMRLLNRLADFSKNETCKRIMFVVLLLVAFSSLAGLGFYVSQSTPTQGAMVTKLPSKVPSFEPMPLTPAPTVTPLTEEPTPASCIPTSMTQITQVRQFLSHYDILDAKDIDALTTTDPCNIDDMLNALERVYAILQRMALENKLPVKLEKLNDVLIFPFLFDALQVYTVGKFSTNTPWFINSWQYVGLETPYATYYNIISQVVKNIYSSDPAHYDAGAIPFDAWINRMSTLDRDYPQFMTKKNLILCFEELIDIASKRNKQSQFIYKSRGGDNVNFKHIDDVVFEHINLDPWIAYMNQTLENISPAAQRKRNAALVFSPFL